MDIWNGSTNHHQTLYEPQKRIHMMSPIVPMVAIGVDKKIATFETAKMHILHAMEKNSLSPFQIVAKFKWAVQMNGPGPCDVEKIDSR